MTPLPEAIASEVLLAARVAFVLCAIAGQSASHAQQEAVQDWPLVAEFKSRNFSDLKVDLKQLVKLLDESELAYVVRINDTSISGYERSDGRSIEVEIADRETWLELMSRTNILSADKSDAVYTFAPFGQPIGEAGAQTEWIWYEFSEHLPLNACAPEYREMACGLCELVRDGNWSVRFSWSSGRHVQEYIDSVEEISQLLDDGEITSKEWSTRHADYFSKMFERDEECISRGLEDMGLENPSDFF